MDGIVFFATGDLGPVVEFYADVVGAEVWLEQPDCTVLTHGGFRFGFCGRAETDDCAIPTFVYDDRAGVDAAHERVGDRARDAPAANETYDIYRFFADDPDGRTAEFQTFLDPAVE